jgi:uncharacterized protein (DUF305 family)
MKKSITIGAAAAALITLTACSSSDQAVQNGAPATTSATAPAAGAHNQADVTFAQQMIPHHEQAIQMSDMLLGKKGIDPRVVGLANQIKAAQGPEIQQMQGWLAQWGASTTSPGMSAMPGHSMPGMSTGQGMMSDQDMMALQNAQGVQASRLFLTQMITHHQGAITMAQTEIDTGQYPAAVALARSIVTSQQAEIGTMQGILGTL